MELLNKEQKYAIDCVMEGSNILLTGSAGTGKSYTIKYIIEYLKENNKKFAVTATTGTAAVMIGGQTLHSFLGLGHGTASTKEIYSNILRNKKKYDNISCIDTLIIDEVSMLDKELFEKISELLSLIKLNDGYFGNIQLILIGDFCQLAPVKGQFCFLSDLWNKIDIKVVLLRELIRQSDDLLFQNILRIIRKGRCTDNIITVLNKLRDTEFDNGIIPTRLYPVNIDVDKINSIETKIEKYREKTPQEKLELRSLDSGPFNQKLTQFFDDKLQDIEKSGKNEYVITPDDVENYSQAGIKNSFNNLDSEEDDTNTYTYR